MSQPSSFLRLNDKSKAAQGPPQQASSNIAYIGYERGPETPWLTNRHNLSRVFVAKNRKDGFPEEYPAITHAQRGLFRVPEAVVGAAPRRTPNSQAFLMPASSKAKETKGVAHAAPEESMTEKMMTAKQDPSNLQVEVIGMVVEARRYFSSRPGEGFPGFEEILEKLCSWEAPASHDTLQPKAPYADNPAEHPL